MEWYKKTIQYYNDHAKAFCESTKDLFFTEPQKRFLRYLQKGDRILDLGCGAGRDTIYFLEHGFQVDAVDGSEKICELASEYTGISVKKMFFNEFSAVDQYHGIWACASILHLTYDELPDILQRIARALKESGVFYTSFKYGEEEGVHNNRYFTNMTENKLQNLMSQIVTMKVKDIWLTSDIRKGREEEK